VVGTVGLAIVGGLNALSGVNYLSNWIVNFNIMYMVFALSSLTFMWLCAICLRYTVNDTKPWQIENELFWLLVTYSSVILITMIPLAVYAFLVGNVAHYCDSTTCDVNAYIQGKIVYATLWISFSYLLSTILKAGFLIQNRNVDLKHLNHEETLAAVASRTNGAPPGDD